MRTFKEYQEKLNSMRKNVYINGELVERNDPRLLGGQNIMGITFDAAMSDDPELRELATATSHLTGHTINRFTQIYQTPDDLLKKQAMIRNWVIWLAAAFRDAWAAMPLMPYTSLPMRWISTIALTTTSASRSIWRGIRITIWLAMLVRPT